MVKESELERLALGMVAIAMLTGAIMLSATSYADDSVVDEINITVPESCTLSGTGMNTHNATINNGSYNSAIGETTLKAYCNDTGGFAIYAAGYTDNIFGKNVLSSLSLGSTYDIATGTATSGDNSNWAMKLSTVSSPTPTYPISIQNSFDSFHNVPNEYTLVAKRESGTDIGESAEGSTLKTTYQAYISKTQPAGTYSGQVKYTMVHPASEIPVQPQTTDSGKICYYANASDALGSMGCQDVATSVTLLASNFSRTGYGFAGWSTTFDYSDSTGFYGPNETITLNTADYSSPNDGLSLYAYWIKSAGNLQGWTGCPSLQSGAVTALSDQRDDNTYAVAKLADDNCWMIENLRLENTGTDNANGSLSQGYGGQFAGLAEPEPAWTNESTTANSLYSTDGADGTINIGTSDASYRFPRYNNINTSSRASSPATNSTTMYSYGNYYTWAAAIADTAAYSSGDYGTTSICPTGWRLPIGAQSTTDKSFGALSVALGGPANGATANSSSTPTGTVMSNIFRSYPNNFVYSGNFYSGSVDGRGSRGYYWSSTTRFPGDAYNLRLNSSSVLPGTDYNTKYGGRTVRCVVSGV